MTVVLINEDNHGLLGVAKNYKSAVKFLIAYNYITETSEVWADGNYDWAPLIDVLGKDALDIMTESWDINTFNDFWEGTYFLSEVEVYE